MQGAWYDVGVALRARRRARKIDSPTTHQENGSEPRAGEERPAKTGHGRSWMAAGAGKGAGQRGRVTADGWGEPDDCKNWGTLIPGELGCCEKP